ncbi:response regulator [Stagnimonas aquatica]|uniref:histidine kinase n=1 Tax=Stagnimonas aquatica TaxID=2689987 RepID=A0A3N0VHK0_9GAMM|nr:response regulator [Stagnimonas aquatica]
MLFLVSASYVGLLFGIAHYGDRVSAFGRTPAQQPLIYSLALGVYCTSWTFYGAVGRAADSGWDFLPIYLGPLLVFVFGMPLLSRIIEVSKRHNITSIADFIGARYGRHQSLALWVTLIAVLGVLPYIALQLKAVAFGFEVLASPLSLSGGLGHRYGDSALVVAALLAVFAILFGTRQVVSSENHHGMVLAIAFESVIKLLAFLAVGLYVCYGIYDGFGDAYQQASRLPQLSEPLARADWQLGFWTQTLLAALAVICLPRQFHVAVVESTSPRDLRRARWVFPLYLVLISLFVVPIATAGLARLPAGTAADTYLLALPLANGHGLLSLAAYLGGFSAATSMVIVETIALSTMLSNEVVMPVLLRSRRLRLGERGDLSWLLKLVRRVAIVVIIAAAYLYYRLFTGLGTLSAIGLLSFAAVAQFAPAVIGGMVWRGGSYRGAVWGLLVGFSVWAYTLLLPALLSASGQGSELLAEGPLGVAALRPQALFGLDALDPVAHGTFWSLATNLCFYLLVSWLAQPRLAERLQAVQFLTPTGAPLVATPPAATPATVGDLLALLERFLGSERAQSLLGEFSRQRGKPLPVVQDRADRELLRFTEHLLAGALGASSARLLLASTLRGRDMLPEDVIRLLDETSHAIVFSQERLRATLEHLSQGVSVVDKDLRLVAWNRRYQELFAYPPELIHVGQPIENLFRHNAERGLLGEGDVEALVARRMEHLQRGTAYVHERALPDGTVIEIRGMPMPSGGFVTSYSDVTAYTRAQQALREANDTLETRVAERTGELAEAKAEAERANAAKTRFLAAASHDLVQPLHAARLFLAAADRSAVPADSGQLLDRIGDSLQAAEQLLSGLLDISKLDAGALPVHRETFAAGQVLDPLAREFEALAAARGLRFRYRPSAALLHSDPALLRRVLQNFLGNALRYTRSGGVLLGSRRSGGGLRLEVWDTGPGIPADKQREIFEEFRRLHAQDAVGERGLGLGLAISERIARLLGHPLALGSRLGRGSVFSITVPLGSVGDLVVPAPVQDKNRAVELRSRILVVDNEPLALAALTALLQRWGHEVLAATSAAEGLRLYADRPPPDLILADYHLDHGESGIEAIARFRAHWGDELPCAVITADPTRAARDEAAALGHAFLQKPVKPAALRALVQRLLGG